MKSQMVMVGGIVLTLAILFMSWPLIQQAMKSSEVMPEVEKTTQERTVDEEKIQKARESNPDFKEIHDMIKKMEKSTWNKVTYDQIKIEIKAKVANFLLKPNEKALLVDMLELAYIALLKEAMKQFFAHSTQVSDFYPINQELQKYASGYYNPNVKDMLKPANDFTRLIRVEKESRKLAASDVQEPTLESQYQVLVELENKPLLSSSSLVKSICNGGKAVLEDKFVQVNLNKLEEPIKTYVTTSEYTEATTNDYSNQLSSLRNHKRVAPRREIKVFCTRAQNDLDDHKNSHEKFEFYCKSSQSSEEAFGKYGYYVKKCQQARATAPVNQN